MLYNTPYSHGGATGAHIDLSASLNPLPLPRAVKKAYKGAFKSALSYPDPYCRALCAAISRKEGVPEEYVLCGNGASELLYAFVRAVRPKKAALITPCYTGYTDALSLCGSETVFFPLSAEKGFKPDPDAFISFLENEAPDAVFLCSPNNPTGALLPLKLIEKAALYCSGRGAYLLLDECFRDLADGESSGALLSACPRLFILKALTKSFSLAGLRIGYALCADKELAALTAAQTDPWSVSVPAQKAGAAALSQKGYLEKSRALIKTERERLIHMLEGAGLTVFPSDANFILFKGSADLGGRLLEKGVAVRVCGDFEGLSPEYYRVAVRGRKENGVFINAVKDCLRG